MFNLVIPTDFTDDNRETVFSFLDVFFDNREGEITHIILLNAYDTPHVGQSVMHDMGETLKNISEEDLEREKKKFNQRYQGRYKYELSTYTNRGSLTSVLHKFDNENEIDFAVLSYKPDTFFNKIFRNSALNPSKIVNSLNEPILFLPRLENVRDIKQIMFGVDLEGIDNAQDFKLFLNFAKYFHAHVNFVHIDTGNETPAREKFDKLYGEMLNNFTEEYKFVEIESPTVKDGYLQYLKENDPDMLVLIERKSNFLKSFLGDSFADDLSATLNRPLLVLSETYDA